MHEEAGTAVAEVVTGEAVILDVPCARFPSRLLALALDLLIQCTLLFVLFLIVGLAVTNDGTNGATADGGPERFRQALVRGLAAVVEIWLLLGCPALISSLLSERGKRLGDLFAGTFVIQQRFPAGRSTAVLPAVSPELAVWGASLEMSGLTDQTAETARRYLARLPELTPAAQAELGERIAGAVRAQVSPLPPPGTPAIAYLSAVLAQRRNREHARLAPSPAPGTAQAAMSPAAAGTAGAGAAGVETGTAKTGGTDRTDSGIAWRPPAGAAGDEPAGSAREGVAQGHEPPARDAGGFVPPA